MLRKRNYGAKLVELSPASLERSLSLPVQSRMPAAPARATFPTPDSVPQASPGIAAGFLPLLVDPPSKRLRSSQAYPAPAASARKCFLPFLWRPRVTARHTPLAASRGPPATLSPAPRRSRRLRSHTALGSDSSNRRRELHRQGQDPGPQSEAARLGLSVPGAPPSWPLNTQRCSDRRRRLAQPIVERELHLPKDTAELQVPEGHAADHSCTLEEDRNSDLPRGFLGIVVFKGR